MAPKSKNQSALGERAIRCGKTAIQFGGSPAELSEQLRGLAWEISAGLSCLEPSPDNFSECYDAWQSGEMTATCGLSRKAFYRMVARIRSSEEYAV